MPGFFTPFFAWLFLLIGPLILFYFLKLKRPRLAIPSLVLWQQVLQDSRVNSPFQRFKRNILLMLQLLLLCLLVLATMQPYFRGSADRAQRLPILIDCSASMAAYDKQGGRSRLAEAKDRVSKLIDGMLPDQQICLIAFSSSARKLTDFTDNKRVLLAALDSIAVADVPSDLSDALRLVTALARREPFDRVLLLSDGNFPASTDVELAFKIDYQKIAPGGPNLGITAVSAKRSGDDMQRWDLFVRVESSSAEPTTATLELLDDGRAVGTEDLAIPAGGAQRLMFPIVGGHAARLELRLKPDHFDALAADNTAYIDLETPRPVRVWIPTDLPSFRLALRSRPNVELFPREGAPEATGDGGGGMDFDLIITDKADAAGRSAKVIAHVGVIPEAIADLATVTQESNAVIDWRRTEPLLEHVQLADVIILDNIKSNDQVAEQDYENRGYEVLAHGRQGPLILRQKRGQTLTYNILFHPDRSTLPYRIGFPILATNLVAIAMEKAGLSETLAAQTGVLPALRVTPAQEYTVKGPAGQAIDTLTSDATGMLQGAAARRVGRYQVARHGEVRADVGVSLLSPSETRLIPAEQIQFRELTVAAAAEPLKTDRSFWRWLTLAALCVLVGEWWYFHRKPGGFV